MFVAKNQVRLHDTDMAGILYFPRQFRFVHDAMEDFVAKEGLSFNKVFFKENFVFVVVHAEADYLHPLKIGDALKVCLMVEKIGTSSFSIIYNIYKEIDDKLVGKAKTVYVTLDSKTRKTIPIPIKLKSKLENHLQN